MVAAGLSGPARMAVGGVRDYVLGVTMLDGRGELLSFGGQVMKNVAGYDVVAPDGRLAGRRLGVLCEVSLKVLPAPSYTSTLRFDCSEGEALTLMQRWAGQPLPVNATAWWQGVLVVRLSGAHAAVTRPARSSAASRSTTRWRRASGAACATSTHEFFVEARRSLADGCGAVAVVAAAGAPSLPLPRPAA